MHALHTGTNICASTKLHKLGNDSEKQQPAMEVPTAHFIRDYKKWSTHH